MRPSDDCIELIKRLEGFRAKPYRCPGGQPTIGYGACYYADGHRVTMRDATITPDAADALLRAIAARVWGSVQGMVHVPLTQGQVDALTMMAYNIGETAFHQSTLIRKLNKGDYTGAAAEFPRWSKGGGVVLAGLEKRRALERRMFEGAAS
jgi:lysozyme